MLQPEKEEIRQKHDIFIMNRDTSSFVQSLSVFVKNKNFFTLKWLRI